MNNTPTIVLHLLVRCTLGGSETLLLDYFRHTKGKYSQLLYFKKGWSEHIFEQTLEVCQYMKRKPGIDISAIFRLAEYIHRSNIRIIHSHNTIDYIYGTFACMLSSARHVTTFHGYEKPQTWLQRKLITMVMKRAHAAIFVSEAQRDDYVKRYQITNPHVIYNGIDFDKFLANQIDLRKELGIPEEAYILGSVGNFVNRVRDQKLICNALSVAMKNKDFHFVFVGRRAPEHPEIMDECIEICNKSGIGERVHFLGARSDVPSLLGSLDGYVYASNHDTFGISVIEAACLGMPLIINALPVFQEILQDCHVNFYPTKDSETLSDSITKLIDNVDSETEKSKCNATVVRERFSIEKYTENISRIYSRLA